MRVLESKIFDCINSLLLSITMKTDAIRQNSFILSNIDWYILAAIIFTLIISTIAPTETIGIVSVSVPLLVVLKVFITKCEKIELDRANFFLLLYFLICLISNFTSSMIPQSLYGFMKTSMYLAFYFALCQFLKSSPKYIKYILIVIACLVFAESFIGIMQHFAGVENISTWQDTSYVNPEDVISRVYGTLKPYNPNLFAAWLIAALPSIGIFTVLNGYKGKLSGNKFICFVAAAFIFLTSILTIFFTGCRGAYIALFIMFIAFFTASFQIIFANGGYRHLKQIWLNTLIASLAAGMAFLVVNHGVLKRIMSIFIMRADSSTSFRMNVYSSAIQMFRDNWLQGIGVGNKVFREIYGLYMLSGFDALSCYCVFLEIAVESGIFALLAFLSFLIILLYDGIKAFITNNNLSSKILIFISFVSVSAVMVHGFVDTVFFRPQVQFVFWTMAAILLTLTKKDIKDY